MAARMCGIPKLFSVSKYKMQICPSLKINEGRSEIHPLESLLFLAFFPRIMPVKITFDRHEEAEEKKEKKVAAIYLVVVPRVTMDPACMRQIEDATFAYDDASPRQRRPIEYFLLHQNHRMKVYGFLARDGRGA